MLDPGPVLDGEVLCNVNKMRLRISYFTSPRIFWLLFFALFYPSSLQSGDSSSHVLSEPTKANTIVRVISKLRIYVSDITGLQC